MSAYHVPPIDLSDRLLRIDGKLEQLLSLHRALLQPGPSSQHCNIHVGRQTQIPIDVKISSLPARLQVRDFQSHSHLCEDRDRTMQVTTCQEAEEFKKLVTELERLGDSKSLPALLSNSPSPRRCPVDSAKLEGRRLDISDAVEPAEDDAHANFDETESTTKVDNLELELSEKGGSSEKERDGGIANESNTAYPSEGSRAGLSRPSLSSKRSNTSDFVELMRLDRSMTTLSGLHSRIPWVENVWNFLSNPETSRAATVYNEIMNPLIITSVIFSLVQSVDPPPLDRMTAINAELGFDVLLAADIIMRVAFSPRRKYFLQNPYNIIDLLHLMLVPIRCLIVFHTQQFRVESDKLDKLEVQNVLICMTPCLRLLKLLRRFEKFHLVLRAFQDALDALPVLLYTLAIVWLFFSALIFLVERHENLDQFPRALWLTIVTMGTVGYGDIAPKEPVGQFVTTALIIISALYMAIPVGIIGNAFNRVWENRDYLLTVQRTRNLLSQLGYTPYDIVALFTRFGSQGGDELTFRQFRRMMISMKLGLPERRLVELFEAFDVDKGGTIDAKEFVHAVCPASYYEIFIPDPDVSQFGGF